MTVSPEFIGLSVEEKRRILMDKYFKFGWSWHFREDGTLKLFHWFTWRVLEVGQIV